MDKQIFVVSSTSMYQCLLCPRASLEHQKGISESVIARGPRLAQSVARVTPDLGVRGSSPTSGRELTLKKKKKGGIVTNF